MPQVKIEAISPEVLPIPVTGDLTEIGDELGFFMMMSFFMMAEGLQGVIQELKKTNLHLSLMTDTPISDTDVEEGEDD